MKTLATLLAGATLALAGSTAGLARTPAESEAKLAHMLEGRTAGEPVNCISALRSTNIQVLEHVGIVYESGNTIYVARPSDPDQLRRNDIVVINRYGGQLCTSDMIRTVDRYQGFTTGAVFLNDFVPYTKEG